MRPAPATLPSPCISTPTLPLLRSFAPIPPRFQIDPFNQCGWGKQVHNPPDCYLDNPEAVREFGNTTRWLRIEGADALPRRAPAPDSVTRPQPSQIRKPGVFLVTHSEWSCPAKRVLRLSLLCLKGYLKPAPFSPLPLRSATVGTIYPRGETAGSLHDGILTMSDMRLNLHFPILLEKLDRGAYADAIDTFCAQKNIVATYSKFVQIFTIAEYMPTREMVHHRISFDRNIQGFDSGMVYRSTAPRIQKWSTVAPILRPPGVTAVQRREVAQLFFHILSNALLVVVLFDVWVEFKAIRKRQRRLKRLQDPDRYEPTRWGDNVDAFTTLMAPFSWSGYDVGIAVYGLLCENVYWCGPNAR